MICFDFLIHLGQKNNRGIYVPGTYTQTLCGIQKDTENQYIDRCDVKMT